MNGAAPPLSLLGDISRDHGGGWRPELQGGKAWFHCRPFGAPEYWAARLTKGKRHLDVRWHANGDWSVTDPAMAPIRDRGRHG